MVDKNIINTILEDIINNYSWKCGPTIAEMHSMLSGVSHDEHYGELMDKDLLNPLESKDYVEKLERLQSVNRWLDNNPIDDEDRQEILDLKTGLENELFQYNRRLIEGLKYNPIPKIDKSSYVGEEDSIGGVTRTIGSLERSQIQAQQQSVKVDNTIDDFIDDWGTRLGRYHDERLISMNNYFNGDVEGLNYWISHKGYLKALNNEQKKSIKNIDSLMDESPGLTQDTILYRGGYFDIHLKPGDSFKFKGYQSTTFSRATAESYNEDKEGSSMTYVIYAPKGTKGIVGNDNRFDNGQWEHEYVLPRNTNFKVLNIDYDKNICEVVIE